MNQLLLQVETLNQAVFNHIFVLSTFVPHSGLFKMVKLGLILNLNKSIISI